MMMTEFRVMLRLAAAVTIALVTVPKAFAADGDPTAGERVFGRCASCHAVAPGENGIGPSLDHVFGQPGGSVEGYSYSPALKNAGVVWDEASLDKFLQNPAGFVRGTKMFLGVANAKDRQDVIAYLRTLSP